MLYDFLFKNSRVLSLENEFKNILHLNDTRSVQLAFLKTLTDHGLLKSLMEPNKNANFLKKLITIGSSCQTHGLLLSLGAHCFAAATALQNFANTTLQKKVYNEMLNGTCITAFAATEPEAGSDIMAMQTAYSYQENKFKLNGEKSYITNATTADYFLVFATKNNKLYDRGLSLFLIASNTPGIKIEPLDTTHALNHSGLGNITFENVVLDHDCLVGKECQAASIFRESLKIERCYILIPHIGTMLRWYHQCVVHIKTRTQFKTLLHQFQYISDKIIEMHEKIKISHLLAQDIFQQPKLSEAASSHIKNYISDALQVCHQHTLSIFGATAIFGDQKFTENLIDSFSTSIYSGTREMQKNIILNAILGYAYDNPI